MTIYRADLILIGIDAKPLAERLHELLESTTARFEFRQGSAKRCQLVMNRTEQGDATIQAAIDAIKAMPDVTIISDEYDH